MHFFREPNIILIAQENRVRTTVVRLREQQRIVLYRTEPTQPIADQFHTRIARHLGKHRGSFIRGTIVTDEELPIEKTLGHQASPLIPKVCAPLEGA
jgi:hypothetical protein